MQPDANEPLMAGAMDDHRDVREHVLNQLRSDWLDRQAKELRTYLDHLPSLVSDHDFVLDLITTDMLCRERAGVAIDKDVYTKDFPHLTEAIERQWLVYRELIAIEDTPESDTESTSHSSELSSAASHETLIQSIQPSAANFGSSPTSLSTQLPNLPGYVIAAELGRGGMGVVYKAVQTQLKRTVAIKMLRQQNNAERESLERLRSEAASIARLKHPNIVQIYDCYEHQGLPVLILEYVEGQSLTDWCRDLRPISCVVRLMEVIARAVDYAHRQGIVHRDLKPANILLAHLTDRNAEGRLEEANSAIIDELDTSYWQPKIADFGLAKQFHAEDQQLTQTAAILGTAAYLSPEQAWGRSREVGPASDVHALGVILFELLTGQNPFQAESLIHTLDSVRFLKPRSMRDIDERIPAGLDSLCQRCLAKEVNERLASAGELADELSRVLSPDYTYQDAIPVNLPVATEFHGKRVWQSIAWVVGILALACGVLFAFSERPAGNGSPGTAQSTGGQTVASSSPLSENIHVKAEKTPRKTGTNRAFLVGVRAYQFPSGDVQLRYTEADVDEMSRVLNRHGFAREHIQLMTQWSQADNPKLAPSANNLRGQLKQFLDESIADDRVLIMLTGMGGETSEGAEYFYVPSDANLNDQHSLISLSEFLSLLKNCPAKQKLLLVDTCQTVSMRGLEFPQQALPPGVGVLLACSAREVSYEDDGLRHGVFSHFVMRALEGEADTNGDRAIQLSELLAYARSRVSKFVESTRPGGVQTQSSSAPYRPTP